MRPKQILITSANTPFTLPLNYRGGPTSLIATPDGAGNYTIAITTTDIQDSSLTPNFFDIAAMTTETAKKETSISSATALRVILHSGTSVTIDVSQSDV